MVWLTSLFVLVLSRIHNPSNPFPIYRNPDAMEKEEWIRDATGEMKNSGTFGSKVNSSGERHYDNTTERRARGVGFYAFSQNEEERQKQMRELLELRSQVKDPRLATIEKRHDFRFTSLFIGGLTNEIFLFPTLFFFNCALLHVVW